MPVQFATTNSLNMTTDVQQTTDLVSWASLIRMVIRESRPGVQLVFLLRASAGSGLVRHPTVSEAVGVIGWVLLTMAIYVFNGVTDLTADSTNQSSRPIASGELSVTAAVRACVALASAGLLACLVVSWTELGIGIGMLLLGWAYSAGPALKNAPAWFAAVIGAGAAMSYGAGWVASGRVTEPALVVLSGISVWVGVCCVSKDFSDVAGDRAAGRRTWPVVLGASGAARLLATLAPVTAAGFLVSSITTRASVIPALTLLAGSIVLTGTGLRCASAADRPRRRRPYRVFMVTQYIANLSIMTFVSN